MKKLAFLILIVTVSVTNAMAQMNISIKGTTQNGEGRVVELYKYSDQISRQEVLLDKATIGNDKGFELHCYANYPMLVFVQIENYSQSFYVEPGKTYNVFLDKFDWNVDETKNVFLDPVTLPLEFIGIPDDDINLQIDHLNNVVDRYVMQNIEHFDQKFRPQRTYFDSLLIEVKRNVPKSESEFFERYKTFYLAELSLDLKFASKKNVFNDYIKNQPILYYDENYMSLFKSVFSNCISNGTKDISIYRLVHWVNNLDHETYLDSIGMDPMLRNEQVRELAALIALQESYHNFRYYDAEMVEKMIERIASRTKFPEHKVLAEKIVNGFKKAKSGEEIRSYSLPNVDKEDVNLDSFKGKWVYLSFVRVEDPNSIGELETMAHFKDSVYAHSNDIEFVTIVCDREFQKMYHFLKNSKHKTRYNWTWLHFNHNFDLLRDFQVCSYPTFVLINPEGKLYYDITPAPSTGLLVSPPWEQKGKADEQESDFFLNH